MDFISFDELIIIVVIALLVLGPAKTFKLMFSAGQLFAKAKNYLNSVKTQLQIDEIRQGVTSIKENDFHEVVNRISPVPTKSSTQGKRQWTVTADDFKETPSDKITPHDEDSSKADLNKTDHNQDMTEADLILRIEKLEQEIALLKERVAK